MRTLVDRSFLAEMLDVVDGRLFREMLSEIEPIEDLPEPLTRILSMADGTIAGYVTRIISGSSLVAASTSIRLVSLDIFQDEIVTTWFKSQGKLYPRTTTYIISLDLLRRLAIDALAPGP
jgi:hypothetical protein